MIQVQQINTPDKNIQLIQNATQSAVSALESLPLVAGSLLTDQTLTVSIDNKVPHLLDYTPTRCVTVKLDTNSVIWQTAFDDKFVTVRCSASCIASLWVK